jgi:hypothetical protein
MCRVEVDLLVIEEDLRLQNRSHRCLLNPAQEERVVDRDCPTLQAADCPPVRRRSVSFWGKASIPPLWKATCEDWVMFEKLKAWIAALKAKLFGSSPQANRKPVTGASSIEAELDLVWAAKFPSSPGHACGPGKERVRRVSSAIPLSDAVDGHLFTVPEQDQIIHAAKGEFESQYPGAHLISCKFGTLDILSPFDGFSITAKYTMDVCEPTKKQSPGQG